MTIPSDGSWDRLKGAIMTLHGDVQVVSKTALASLDYQEKCRLAYCPETPQAVVDALLYDADQSAVRAAFQRKDVLAGHILNPFLAGGAS